LDQLRRALAIASNEVDAEGARYSRPRWKVAIEGAIFGFSKASENRIIPGFPYGQIAREESVQIGDERLRMDANVVDLGQLEVFVIAILVRMAGAFLVIGSRALVRRMAAGVGIREAFRGRACSIHFARN